MASHLSQKDLIYSYYKRRPGEALPHAEVVDWATSEWVRLTGNVLRDPDRAIRTLHQEGKLVKLENGIYKYDPNDVDLSESLDFSEQQKAQVLKRDNYRCSVCGCTADSGVTMHVDHIRPRDKGGKAEISNAQVLCSRHNNLKKNFEQVEFGKKIFLNLQSIADKNQDESMSAFVREILDIYAKYDIDAHIA